MKETLINLHTQLGGLINIKSVYDFFESDDTFFLKTEYVRLLFQSYHMTCIDDFNDSIHEPIFSHHQEVLTFTTTLWDEVSWYHTQILLDKLNNNKY